jgi:hypothetical protein
MRRIYSNDSEKRGDLERVDVKEHVVEAEYHPHPIPLDERNSDHAWIGIERNMGG